MLVKRKRRGDFVDVIATLDGLSARMKYLDTPDNSVKAEEHLIEYLKKKVANKKKKK